MTLVTTLVASLLLATPEGGGSSPGMEGAVAPPVRLEESSVAPGAQPAAAAAPQVATGASRPGVVVSLSPLSLLTLAGAVDVQWAMGDAWAGYVGAMAGPPLLSVPPTLGLELGARRYFGRERFQGFFYDLHAVASSTLVGNVMGGGVLGGWSWAPSSGMRLSLGLGADGGVTQYGRPAVVPRLRASVGWAF